MQPAARSSALAASDRILEAELLALPGFEKHGLRARPFLKWAGGKGRLVPHLLAHVPRMFARYHEPFVGGGAMFFAVAERARGEIFLSDLNDEVINAWQVVRDHGTELLDAIRRYRTDDSREFYYSVRQRKPESAVDKAARFIYLNQTAWNGLWRVNKYGQFNVPWGDRSFRGLTKREIDVLALALRDVSIEALDFREALTRTRRGDFVYLDPPYLPVSDTSKFFFYTEKRFRAPDLRELGLLCQEMTRRGVNWILSNRDTPLVREVFSDAKIVSLTTRRSVAAQNRRDVEPADSPEVIVIGSNK